MTTDARNDLGPIHGLGYSDPVSDYPVDSLGRGASESTTVRIAEEVPVALVYNTVSFVVVMSSPVDLEDLAIGFSLTEGLVDDPAHIGAIDVVRHSRGIELQMTVPESVMAKLDSRRRGIESRSGCGLCGVESIDKVLVHPRIVTSALRITHEALWSAAAALETCQTINHETRAVHAAAFARANGELVCVREDVGRHNALDKVIGAMARASIDASDGFLVVTSRASYELIQKAASAGAPLLAAVSRPTGLAIQLADQAGITLVGLLRGRTASVYTHSERLSAS